MTKQDVMDALKGRRPDQELQWMVALGANLTVSARGYYPVETQLGSLSHLMGFNELQHQVYGRIRKFGRWKRRSSMESPVISAGPSNLQLLR